MTIERFITRLIFICVLALLTWQCSSEAEQTAHQEESASAQITQQRYNLGIPATAQEIAGWDIDIRPDGAGLPVGSGTAQQGEPLYETKCAACHGSFGEGEGRWSRLAGGQDSLTNQGADGRPEKSVGSYWPYASTLFDYIRRAMPYTEPMTLSAKEAYALSAYVLYLNDLIEYDFVLDAQSLPNIVMPNQDNFYLDDRPDVHNTACMSNCKDIDSIGISSRVRGVTPTSHFRQGEDSPAASHDAGDLEGTSVVAQGRKGQPSTQDPLAQGKIIYQSNCAACHQNNGEGLPPAFPSLHNNPIVQDQAAIITTIMQGSELTAMQPFAHMSNDDLASLISFIRGSWGNDASVVTAAHIEEAR